MFSIVDESCVRIQSETMLIICTEHIDATRIIEQLSKFGGSGDECIKEWYKWTKERYCSDEDDGEPCFYEYVSVYKLYSI